MIEVEKLCKSFATGKGTSVKAVDSLSFSVNPGEVFGLLGPNGAGKTTTLRMVMGLLAPDSGWVEVGGIRSDQMDASIRKQLCMISTNDGVYQWLTAREMLAYFGDLYSVPRQTADDRIETLSKLLKFERILDQRCVTLSTGQRQRVILARGLIHDPPVILMDEPTRGLDVIGSRTVFDFLSHLRAEGKAILISTHRLDEAERFCDRFGLIHNGSLRYDGSLTDLRETTGKQSLVEMFSDLLDSATRQDSAA